LGDEYLARSNGQGWVGTRSTIQDGGASGGKDFIERERTTGITVSRHETGRRPAPELLLRKKNRKL